MEKHTFVVQISQIMATCSNPGCDQPGTNKCSACKMKPYCGPKCQTADWVQHKEECPGHLRKVGMANLEKAKGFHREQNWSQILRYSDLAATKLKQLKERPIEAIDDALELKYHALNSAARYREALECAKERYCLYLTEHTHPPAIRASFDLIQSCIHNKEFFDAALYARTLWETINDKTSNNKIPVDQRQPYISRGASELSRAILRMAQNGGVSAEALQNRGLEAIMLARKALEINTRLYGTESEEVAGDMGILAQILNFFNDVDDDEILRLLKQTIDIYARVNGRLSSNVAAGENSLANAYARKATKAYNAKDMDRRVANLELALPHYREAARIYRAVNHLADADRVARSVAEVEKALHCVPRS